ncbi:hypothetical protein ACVWXM_009940 [Bradyrhizobium sp. GM7.3]
MRPNFPPHIVQHFIGPLLLEILELLLILASWSFLLFFSTETHTNVLGFNKWHGMYSQYQRIRQIVLRTLFDAVAAI